MKTAILTDTNSGISVYEGEQLGIFVIPMPVIIDDKDYLEAVDITHKNLYDAMRENKNISSSQPSVGVVTDMWSDILNKGYDDIVYIPMSSGLSGSCETATQFSKEFDGKVQVVDNHRISVTLRASVLDALELSKKGLNAVEIKDKLEENAYQASIYIAVDSLEYLKKSGRVTPSAATIAMVMSIKPVLTIQGGKLDSFAKVRGMKQASKKMIEALKNDLETRFSDVPRENLRIAAAGTFEDIEDTYRWRNQVQEAFPDFDVYYDPLSCSIACHVGMNAVGIGISKIEDRTDK